MKKLLTFNSVFLLIAGILLLPCCTKKTEAPAENQQLQNQGGNSESGEKIDLPEQKIGLNIREMKFELRLPSGTKWDTDAPNTFKIWSDNPDVINIPAFQPDKFDFNYRIPVNVKHAGHASVRIQVEAYYCSNSEQQCFKKPFDYTLPLIIVPNGLPELSVKHSLANNQ